MGDSHGRFVWYELMTTDMKAARTFYAKVIGWGTENASMPGMPYSLFTVAGASVSGLMGLPEDAKEMGVKPSWIGYVAVDDVDAAASRVAELGGTVHVGPREIGDISRFAVFVDPQMAGLALLQWLKPRRERPAEPSATGRVGWHELLAADVEKAFGFYSDLLGWQKAQTNQGERGAYQRFSAGGQTIGGMYAKPPTAPSSFWLYYFNVADIDAAAERVTVGGGQIIEGPLEVPEDSWIIHGIDPQGAMFALEGKRGRKSIGYFERTAPDAAADARGRRWYW